MGTNTSVILRRTFLSQTLRLLKRDKEAVAKVGQTIRDANSILKDGVREIDVRKALTHRDRLKRRIVETKLALQEASRPVQRKIFEIDEFNASHFIELEDFRPIYSPSWRPKETSRRRRPTKRNADEQKRKTVKH